MMDKLELRPARTQALAAGAAESALAIEAGRQVADEPPAQPQPPERTNGHHPDRVPTGVTA
jgi:hypothetical protein